MAITGFVSSCHPGGTPSTQTTITIPQAWQASGQRDSRKISTGWLRDFDDPQLPKLIDEAMANNPNLLATAQRLEAARANVVRARARRMPNADIRANTSRTRAEDGGVQSGPDYSSNHSLSLGVSWEVDLWGRLHHLHSAAEADYQSTVADFRATRLSLAANIASAWYQLITSESQTKLSEETLARYNKVARIIERNYRAGTSRSLDLQLSRNNVYNEERTLQGRLRNRDDAKRNLEILLGRYPKAAMNAPSDLPDFRKNIPAGLPSDLLNRRPDLVRAQQRLIASFHRAVAAQKNLLPAIRLTGSSGTRSPQLSDLLNIDHLVSSISGSLTQSIFEGGALREEARAEVAKNRAAIYDYANVALAAFREVESRLAAEDYLAKEEEFQRKSLRQAVLAEKQAGRDYAEGVRGTDILNLLEAQRRASNARDSLIVIRNQRIQNRISLHLALGGDFKTVVQ